MIRFGNRPLALLAAAVLLASCGGGSGDPDPTTTTVPDPKEVVRAQLDSVVTNYVDNVIQQMPPVTTKVKAPELLSCVKTRVNQMIDSTSIQPGQEPEQFATQLLEQTQASIYGLVGACAQMSG